MYYIIDAVKHNLSPDKSNSEPSSRLITNGEERKTVKVL